MSPCTRAASFEMLVGLWSGDLAVEDAEALEEHLIACEACAAADARLAKLAGGLRDFVPPVISRAHRERLVAKGMRVLVTEVNPAGQARAHFAPEIDLLIHVLRGDLSMAERVDVELLAPDGTGQFTFEAVPFDAGEGEVLIACQRHYEPLGEDVRFRVHAVEGGTRHHVGDYLVHHVWR